MGASPRGFESLRLRHSRKMRTRQGAHFFVEAEEEKKGGPLRQKFISGKDEFPTYTCLKMCSNDTLPQGSAACAARRFRPLLWFERAMKFAKMLRPYKALSLWRTSLRLPLFTHPRCPVLVPLVLMYPFSSAGKQANLKLKLKI